MKSFYNLEYNYFQEVQIIFFFMFLFLKIENRLFSYNIVLHVPLQLFSSSLPIRIHTTLSVFT